MNSTRKSFEMEINVWKEDEIMKGNGSLYISYPGEQYITIHSTRVDQDVELNDWKKLALFSKEEEI